MGASRSRSSQHCQERVSVFDEPRAANADEFDFGLHPETGPIEGTGIGLLITKKLAELMGGRVGFESSLELGSRFWVDLPLSAAAADARERESWPSTGLPFAHAPRGVVLYVEDNPANIAFMCD